MPAATDAHERVREAWRLALAGDTDGARRLLRVDGQWSLSVEGADLLARLAVKDGQLATARRVWAELLEVAPKYGPAVRAMACIESAWLFRAVCRRLVLLLVMMIGLSLAVVGGLTLLTGIPESHVSIMLSTGLVMIVAAFLAGVGLWLLLASDRRV